MIDLFDNPDLIPPHIVEILDKYGEVETYEQCEALKQELQKQGYTITYGLDAVPYWLRKQLPKIKQH